MGAAIAEAEIAIAQNRNNARAYADIGFWSLFVGRSRDGFANIEKAFQLSPRDPSTPTWHAMTCFLHLSLAEWEQAINACDRSLPVSPAAGTRSSVSPPPTPGWAARAARRTHSRSWIRSTLALPCKHGSASNGCTNSPSGQRWPMIAEGLRKAGLPEK